MSLVKAHITFDSSIENNAEALKEVFEKIRETTQISDINQKRFDRYAILTGVIEESFLEQVRHTAGVQSVEVDQEKFLSQ